MEFEQLDLGKKCILNAISRQEVAEYYDILHPNVLVVTHFRYPPLPPIIANTIPTLARVHRAESKETLKHVYANNPWRMANKAAVSVKGKGDSNGIKPVHDAKEGATVSKGVSGSGANAARVHLMVDDKNRKGQPRASLSAADMPYVADIVEGPLLATARFYTILHWMNQGSHIAETNVDMEVRKVILQESDVLPPPPPPKNEAEWYARLGRQHTDRNQRLSRLIVTYGRELLMFRDECYFEDGCIVTVHRFMLTTQEMLEAQDLAEYHQQSHVQRRIEAMKAERDKFYAAENKRIDMTSSATEPILDFTFCNVGDPVQLLCVQPVAGKVHTQREVKQAVEPHLAHGVFLYQRNDTLRGQKEQRVVVKARNKAGDEEVYEFVDNKNRFDFLCDPKSNIENALQNIEGNEKMYSTTSVRISGCKMTSTELLVPVLRRLVASAIMTIRSLDLSDNGITVLPDLSLLPLQRLLLHQNKISDWAQIENRVCPLPLLQAVTLHGNPIAENDEQYWQSTLARLLRHPRRAVRLRQLDFVTLTAQDYNIAGAFDMFTTGNTRVLDYARGKCVQKKGKV